MKPIKTVVSALLCMAMLCSCGEEDEMQYIKTSVMYETFYNMYSYPDDYLGKQYHMVGELYVHDDTDNGEPIYSVYCEQDGAGLGIELDWDNFGGLAAGDTITVEGRLEQESGTHHDQQVEYLVLRVTMLEKRTDS